MIKINLAKYGFTRKRAADKTTDDLSYTAYGCGKLIVFSATKDDKVYFVVEPNSELLPSDINAISSVYAVRKYQTGILAEDVTEELLTQFYNECTAFDTDLKKREEAIAAGEWISYAKALEAFIALRAKYADELAVLNERINPTTLVRLTKEKIDTIMRARQVIYSFATEQLANRQAKELISDPDCVHLYANLLERTTSHSPHFIIASEILDSRN